MANTMDDFLKKYYRLLHVQSMPEEVLARLVDNKKKGLLTPHQAQWFEDYLEPDPNKDNKLGYKAKDLPEPKNPAEISEEELEKLYRSFTVAFAGMKSKSIFYDSIDDADALNFIKLWMDERKVFPIPKATKECEASIKNIIKLTEPGQPYAQDIKRIIVEYTKKDDGTSKLFANEEKLDKLLQKCKDKKYNKDKSVQDNIKRVAQTLDNYLNTPTYGGTDKIRDQIYTISDDLNVVLRERAFSKIDIDPTKFKNFKDMYATELLDTLYFNKKIRDKFKPNDLDKITDKIEKNAEGEIAWHDPKANDYVEPKLEDVLTPAEQIKKWATDTYKDTIQKYQDLRGGKLFFDSHAKEIFKAIDKKGIKPTDGLPALLDKSKDIKSAISNKTVEQYFDWFIDTMNSVKDKIPNAIAGAWSNGAQMKCVVGHIILRATDPKNDDPLAMDKARAAMEILTAMKYGMLTSKIMDTIKGTEFSIFSDGKLSWNKNEGIQFITRAFDKSIKAAFMGIGYTATFLKNKFFLRKGATQFNDNDNIKGILSKRFQREKANMAKAARDKQELENSILQEENDLTAAEAHKNSFGPNGVTAYERRKTYIDNLIKSHQQKMDDADKKRADHQTNMDNYKATKENLQDHKDAYDKAQKIVNGNGDDIKDLDDQIQQQNQLIQSLETQKNAETDVQVQQAMAAEIAKLKTENAKLSQERNKLLADPDRMKNAQDTVNNFQKDYDAYIDADTKFNQEEQLYNAENQTFENEQNARDGIKQQYNYDAVTNRIDQFNDANKKVKELTASLQAKKDALNNWDQEHVNKMVKLQDFWNFLQTGKTSTMRLSTKAAQKDFDADKNALLANYVANYGLAAA